MCHVPPLRFLCEGVLLLRKGGLLAVAFALRDPYMSSLACVGLSLCVWVCVLRWKPFASGTGQAEARAAQAALIAMQVCACVCVRVSVLLRVHACECARTCRRVHFWL
jgi:hypothetical protein